MHYIDCNLEVTEPIGYFTVFFWINLKEPIDYFCLLVICTPDIDDFSIEISFTVSVAFGFETQPIQFVVIKIRKICIKVIYPMCV